MMFAFLAIIFCAPLNCRAEGQANESDRADDAAVVDEYSEAVSGKLSSAIDDDTKRLMAENGAESSDLSGFGIGELFAAVLSQFTDSLKEPLRVLARIVALMIITAAARSLQPSGGVAGSLTFVTLLGCITVVYQAVSECFSGVCLFLTRLGDFMLAYVPIYASITAATGGIATGGGYYASALWVCEIIAFAADRAVMPLLSLLLAISFTAAINPDMHFSSAAESIKSAVRVSLTALMTIFSGLTTVKSFAAAAADNAAARAAKFGASSFIPIIGGSVSEAYSTVSAGLGLIRTGVGTLGITVLVFMLLQPIVTLITIKITLELSRMIADILGIGEVSELMRSTSYAISAAISTTLCFSMMFIISTAVMMPASANIAM